MERRGDNVDARVWARQGPLPFADMRGYYYVYYEYARSTRRNWEDDNEKQKRDDFVSHSLGHESLDLN